MEQKSVYCIECVCGRQIETSKVELECQACGRKLRIEWSAEIEAVQQKPEAKAA